MRETKFIEQNKEKWSKFEKVLENKSKDPDDLSDLFIEVTDDLSYARTFYPSRSVTVFLNGLAQKIFQVLNGVKYVRKNRFVHFWVEELPQALYMARKELLFSLVVFVLSMLIGAVSTAYDETFPTQIMGEGYMQETMENIKKGDPMAIYKQTGEVKMFLRITINNVRVAFFTFILGIFFSAGSIAFMMYNGVMLGAFQYFFYQQGLLGTSALTIWQHGTLEIASIVIAGGAGITLGKGLVFPGTYSRAQSFFLSAQSGVRVLLGIVPVLVIAGLIEGFYTRYTDAAVGVRLSVIIVSFLFIVLYFIVYPFYKSRKGFTKTFAQDQVFSLPRHAIDFKAIKSIAQIVADTFTIYSRHFRKLFWFSAVLAALSVVLVYFFEHQYFVEETRHFDWPFDISLGFFYFFEYSDYPLFFFIETAVFALSSFVVFYVIESEEEQLSTKPFYKHLFSKALFTKHFSFILLFQALLGVCLFGGVLPVILYFFIWPLISLLQFLTYKRGFKGMFQLFFMMKQAFGKMLVVYICIFALSWIMHMLAKSPLLGLYLSFFTMNFDMDSATLTTVVSGVYLFAGFVVIYLIISLFAMSSGVLFYTMQETGEANDLNEKIKTFGKK
ncbi:MAG: stage II sporulation protein M [Flavobacteriales bacterium]